MAGMLHARNNTILFLWGKMFILMQKIFIVPGMQHGRHAKPLLEGKHSSQGVRNPTSKLSFSSAERRSRENEKRSACSQAKTHSFLCLTHTRANEFKGAMSQFLSR